MDRIITPLLLLLVCMPLTMSSDLVEFHKVSFFGGATFLDVKVDGSESNPQSLLFDTGSIHTYVLNHKMMKELPRAKNQQFGDYSKPPVKGYRKTLISPKSVVTADGSEVNFAGFSGLQLEKWTSKNFTLGSHVWNQRFAVARLPLDQIQKHDPRESGLIGASPDARFTNVHPLFGFIPRDLDKEIVTANFFLDHIQSSWCVGDLVAYTPLVHDEFWLFQGGMKFGTATITSNFKVLVDSGSGLMAIPEPYFSRVQSTLMRFGIDWFSDNMFGKISCFKIHSLPPIHFETESGYTITILPEHYVREYSPGACMVFISRKEINLDWITIGEPMVRFIATEFDAKKRRMGFCEPRTGGDNHLAPKDQTPLVRKTREGDIEEFKRVVNRRVYRNGDFKNNNFDHPYVDNYPSANYPHSPYRGSSGASSTTPLLLSPLVILWLVYLF